MKLVEFILDGGSFDKLKSEFEKAKDQFTPEELEKELQDLEKHKKIVTDHVLKYGVTGTEEYNSFLSELKDRLRKEKEDRGGN